MFFLKVDIKRRYNNANSNNNINNNNTPSTLLAYLKIFHSDYKDKFLYPILYPFPFFYQVTQELYSLPLPDTVPGQTFSYSDHEAVMAKFKITRDGNGIVFTCDFLTVLESKMVTFIVVHFNLQPLLGKA